MKFKKIYIIIISFFFIYSCAEYSISTTRKNSKKIYHSSSGFALIYNDELYKKKVINKKLNETGIGTMHSFLKINTPIKIINPYNKKVFVTKVSKKASFPGLFNIVITQDISSILELDVNNPFVEIIEMKKNKTFIAKKSNIFEEEKNVAEKAPVEEIKMDDLSKDKSTKKVKPVKMDNFILVINDFYYIDSANDLKNQLVEKTKFDNIHVKKINNTKYRLFIGPFKNFNALKNTYISLNNLGFENFNIFRE